MTFVNPQILPARWWRSRRCSPSRFLRRSSPSRGVRCWVSRLLPQPLLSCSRTHISGIRRKLFLCTEQGSFSSHILPKSSYLTQPFFFLSFEFGTVSAELRHYCNLTLLTFPFLWLYYIILLSVCQLAFSPIFRVIFCLLLVHRVGLDVVLCGILCAEVHSGEVGLELFGHRGGVAVVVGESVGVVCHNFFSFRFLLFPLSLIIL